MKRKNLCMALLFPVLAINAANKMEQDCDSTGNHTPLHFKTERPIDNNTSLPLPHSIVRKPTVALSDHTLYLYGGCDGTTMELRDENNHLVFSTYIVPGTDRIHLADTLKGEFRLYIIRREFAFLADIEL